VKVESAAAFEEMRAYLLDLYADVDVVTSLVEPGGRIVDCARYGRPAADLSPPTAVPPGLRLHGTSPPHVASSSAGETSSPRPGGDAREVYPAGTTPIRRTTLERLTRFTDLAAFSAKGGPDTLAAPAASIAAKRYATGEQDLACLGGMAFVNVWSPFATATYQATFSQQWYVAGLGGTVLQTVECGWPTMARRSTPI
jgi:hypothetical protein